jgi:hypothetical protein
MEAWLWPIGRLQRLCDTLRLALSGPLGGLEPLQFGAARRHFGLLPIIRHMLDYALVVVFRSMPATEGQETTRRKQLSP